MAAASAAAQRWGAKLPHGDAHDGAAAGSSEQISEQVSEIGSPRGRSGLDLQQVSEIGSPRNTPRSIRIDEADAERDVAAVAAADETFARARRLLDGGLDRQGAQSEVIRTQSEVIRTHSTASVACSGCHGAVSTASLHAPSLHAPSVALLHLPQLHLSKQGSSVGGTSVSRACESDCMSDYV
jgi:hypothetical protein